MSGNLNSILLDGNLTRDPELRTTSGGTQVCNFGVASNRFYEVNEEKVHEVSFFDVECWTKLAEACNNHLSKGRGVRVVGRIKQDRWKDNSGQNKSRVKIVAEHVVFKPQIKKAEPETSEDEIVEGESYAVEEAAAKEASLL